MIPTNNDDDIEQCYPVIYLEQDQWNFSDWSHPERTTVSESSSNEADVDNMGGSEVGSLGVVVLPCRLQ
jgi:hypothetical protein